MIEVRAELSEIKAMIAILADQTDIGSREVLTVPEASKFLQRHPNRIYELCANGELAHIRDGRTILVSRAGAQKWLRRKLAESGF